MAGLGLLVLAIGFACLSEWRRGSSSAQAGLPTDSDIDFANMSAVLEASLHRLEQDSYAEARKEAGQGNSQLLLDGLYSGALAIAEAVPSGVVDPRLFGVLFSWDRAADLLWLRAFRGVFSEDVILRKFPVAGRNSGVGSKAFASNAITVANTTSDMTHARGEGRLRAIYAIPIQSRSDAADGDAVVLCLNSTVEGAFPEGTLKPALTQRVSTLAQIVRRINALRRAMESPVAQAGPAAGSTH